MANAGRRVARGRLEAFVEPRSSKSAHPKTEEGRERWPHRPEGRSGRRPAALGPKHRPLRPPPELPSLSEPTRTVPDRLAPTKRSTLEPDQPGRGTETGRPGR